MCWNAKVSLNTWLIGLLGTIIMYTNGYADIPTLLFFQSFVSMQLIEYFLWSYPDKNRLFSQIGLGILLLQPLFSLYRNPKVHFLIPFYILSVILLLTIKTFDFRSIKAPNGHLAWFWNPVVFPSLFSIVWLICFFMGFTNSLWLGGWALLLFIFSCYTYFNDDDTIGSMWCWFANSIALFYIIRSILPCV